MESSEKSMDGATARNSRQPAAVHLQNLKLDILMLQRAQVWNRAETTDFLLLSEIGDLLIQREIGSNTANELARIRLFGTTAAVRRGRVCYPSPSALRRFTTW